MRKKRKGFTLIELMIVIAIIAILAAVLVPNFMRAREASRLTACKSNLKNLSTGIETYSNDFDGLYPSTQQHITSFMNNYMQKPILCPTREMYVGIDIVCPMLGGTTYAIYCPAADW